MSAAPETELIVDVDGFEGPIALLLDLARDQKVDLKRISILALAEQYLAFIERADRLQLELAADYLVMAAWLAYLKSRLLPPDPPPEDEPSAVELAEALKFRLLRLGAMQDSGRALFSRPLLGQDVFQRGLPERVAILRRGQFEATIGDLLGAYAAHQTRHVPQVLRIRQVDYYSIEDALRRLGSMIGTVVEWRQLAAFLPPQLSRAGFGASAIAATFAAGLELAKAGRIELRQDAAFGPLWLRAARPQG